VDDVITHDLISKPTNSQSVKRELFGYGHLNRYRQRCGGWRGGRFINSANAKPIAPAINVEPSGLSRTCFFFRPYGRKQGNGGTQKTLGTDSKLDLGAALLGLGGSFLLALARGTFLLCASDRSGEKPSAQGASVFYVRWVHRPEDHSSRRFPNRAIFATLSRKRFPLRML
jgi:hypothetical protein